MRQVLVPGIRLALNLLIVIPVPDVMKPIRPSPTGSPPQSG